MGWITKMFKITLKNSSSPQLYPHPCRNQKNQNHPTKYHQKYCHNLNICRRLYMISDGSFSRVETDKIIEITLNKDTKHQEVQLVFRQILVQWNAGNSMHHTGQHWEHVSISIWTTRNKFTNTQIWHPPGLKEIIGMYAQ